MRREEHNRCLTRAEADLPLALALTHTYATLADGATSIVEMLFCTSLVALVGAGDKPGSSTRKLQIVNTKVSAGRTAAAAVESALSIVRRRAQTRLTCHTLPLALPKPRSGHSPALSP